MPEIRERHNHALGDTGKLAQQRDWVADFLDGAVDDRVVKTAVLQVREPALVEVALHHRDVVLQAVQNPLHVLFNAKAGHSLFALEVFHQLAAAATQVQHVAAVGDQAADEVEVALLVEHGHRLRPLLRDDLGIEEAAHGLAELADLDQEPVVPELRVEFEAGHGLAVVQEGARNAAALVRREQPVGGEVHVQHLGLDAAERVLDAAIFGFQVKGVGGVRDVQIAVRVKAVHELFALVAQVAFNRKV